MRSSVAITIVITSVICAAQAPTKRPRLNTRPAHSSFTCPDPEAQKACKSYEDLLKSRDQGLLSDAYVCFRKKEDEFFLIWFSKPYFRKHWDQDLKEMVVDSEATPPGLGRALTYKDGIENPRTMPYLIFSGKWYPYPESGSFVSDKIDRKQQDENDHDVGIAIDETQINIGYKYTNTFEKTMRYSLTVQRSTGRFVESFQTQEDKMPFSENTGYCTYRKAE